MCFFLIFVCCIAGLLTGMALNCGFVQNKHGCNYMFNLSFFFFEYYERVKHIQLLIKFFFMEGVKTPFKCSKENGAPFFLE
jgi:hypothetical protein